MKHLLLLSSFLVLTLFSNAQPIRVAILDFENISGIAKYDGLGKAMSSMLISDIESNVSPKRLQLVERAQIQKILKEQNFQSTGSVNKSTAVKTGKILGVNYLLVGDVYILNDQLIINARLTNTETGDIVFSKKQEGKTASWLTLKTVIAKELAVSLSQPFSVPIIPDKETSVATITTFGNAIVAKDNGDITKAENLIETVTEFNPEFKYIDELKNEIEEIKKRIVKIEQDLEITTTDPISAAQNYDQLGDFIQAEKYYQIGLKRLSKNQVGEYLIYNSFLSELTYKYKDYEKTLKYCNNILDVYPLYDQAVFLKSQSLINLKKEKEYIDWSKNYLERPNEISSLLIFNEQLKKHAIKNNIEQKIEDISTNGSNLYGFDIIVNSYKIHQGESDVFGEVLSHFSELNTKINGLVSTLNFLKSLNSTPKVLKSELEISLPFYIPKSQYNSKISTLEDNLVIFNSGEPYIGQFFEDSNGKKWTKNGPNQCPCLRLLTNEEFIKSGESIIKADWQLMSFQVEGWYSLMNKETVNARKRFGQMIFYFILNNNSSYGNHASYDFLKTFIDTARNNFELNKVVDVDGYLNYNDMVDFINLESSNYTGKLGLEFLDILCKNKVMIQTDEFCNTILNFGHTYLIEGKYDEALKIYKKLDLNFKIKSFELSVRQIIQNDLSEFVSKGLLSNKEKESLLKKLI